LGRMAERSAKPGHHMLHIVKANGKPTVHIRQKVF
jgi:hypothetical protein